SWTRDLDSFGFTPDGDHAYAATGQTFVGQFTYWTGNLQVIDLGSPTFARTNFGRVSWGAALYLASTSIDVSLNRFPAHVFSGGTSAVIGDTGSANQFRQRLFFSAQPNPTVHKDTLAVPFSSAVSASTNTFISESSLDASEAYVCPPAPTGATAGTFSAVFQKDVGLVQPLPAPIATTADPHGNPQQAAVYQPGVLAVDIGQPFTPEYSQINSGNGSFFKVWGEGGGRPVVTLSKFTTATPQLPYTRQTPDNTELLYSFTDTQADGNYVIALPLA